MQRELAMTADELDEQLHKFISPWKAVGRPNIARFAFRFCERFGIREFPRDPRDYLPLLGIRIANQPTEKGERASWMRVDGHYVISAQTSVDMHLSLSLWHEMFEIMSAHPSYPGLLPVPHEERLADAFATHVLMPADEVRREATELHHPEQDKTIVLSARFGVSLSAIRIRLRELGLQPKPPRRPRYF